MSLIRQSKTTRDSHARATCRSSSVGDATSNAGVDASRDGRGLGLRADGGDEDDERGELSVEEHGESGRVCEEAATNEVQGGVKRQTRRDDALYWDPGSSRA